jgi:hypothetical protein
MIIGEGFESHSYELFEALWTDLIGVVEII